ncbi:MAG: SlyX family protein [Janthinobacterium lividum]
MDSNDNDYGNGNGNGNGNASNGGSDSVSEQRFMDIEIKLTRQEDLVETLNQAVWRQQQKIDELEALCAALVRRVREGQAAGNDPAANERPPHY